jgi:acyl carrier protein
VTAPQIEAWLVRALAHSLQVADHEIDRERPLVELGLDSVAAVELSGRLEDWLGRRVEPTVLWDYPTIRSLAAALASS